VLSTDLSRVYHSFQRRGRGQYDRKREKSLIVTLDPNKFAEKKQKRLDIGNQQTFYPNIVLHNQSSPVRSSKLFYDIDNKSYLSYPPDIKYFLYYFSSPEKPRIAAELRLRVTTRDDPASFESGSDLLKLDGQTWSRPLCFLPRCYNALYKKLREDRLVPDVLDAILSTSTIISKSPSHQGSQRLYTLNDTFNVDFSCFKLQLFVITEQGMEILLFHRQFSEGSGDILPYTGAYTNHHLSILLD
jgi:hypothetical protein